MTQTVALDASMSPGRMRRLCWAALSNRRGKESRITLIEGLALLVIGVVAGFINVLSAGGSMLTLPLLLFLGLSPQVANGTNRVSIVLQSVSAVLMLLPQPRLDTRPLTADRLTP